MDSIPPQVCTFRLGSHWLGVDVQRVREVVMDQERTRLPLAPSSVRGLMNLRGEIVTLIDLRERFGLNALPKESTENFHVVVTAEGVLVSLLVDEVGEVIDIETESNSIPDTLRGPMRELLLGMHQMPNRLILILNLDATLDVPC